jgi:hypothetical protein
VRPSIWENKTWRANEATWWRKAPLDFRLYMKRDRKREFLPNKPFRSRRK